MSVGEKLLISLHSKLSFPPFHINLFSIQSSVVLSALRYWVCLTRRRRRVGSLGASPTCFKLYCFLSKLLPRKRFWRWYKQTNKNPFYILFKQRVYNILLNPIYVKLGLHLLFTRHKFIMYPFPYDFHTRNLKLLKKTCLSVCYCRRTEYIFLRTTRYHYHCSIIKPP